MPLSWCDRLASTPGVGFQLTPHFGLAALVENWSAIMNPLVDQFRNPTFAINDAQNSGFTFTTKDGFVYSSDQTRVVVNFAHRMRVVPSSGGPPVMEMLSTPQPYTKLLPLTADRMVAAARLLPKIGERKIFQVGVISTTRVDLKDAPPGIVRFVEYLKRPWGDKALSMFNIEIIAGVSETENWADFCHHKIIKPENPEEMPTLHFDFHRKFTTGQATTEAHMKTLVSKCSEDALAYFEKIAEGNMFDEHIIGRKAD